MREPPIHRRFEPIQRNGAKLRTAPGFQPVIGESFVAPFDDELGAIAPDPHLPGNTFHVGRPLIRFVKYNRPSAGVGQYACRLPHFTTPPDAQTP